MITYFIALAVYIILMSLAYNIARYMDAVAGTSITETVHRQINAFRRIVLVVRKKAVRFASNLKS